MGLDWPRKDFGVRSVEGQVPGFGRRVSSVATGSFFFVSCNVARIGACALPARMPWRARYGRPDPRIKDALLKAAGKGLVLVAAAGNAGPSSPPLYPAADPNVIAVTATDDEDVLFARANRGDYIAVAAPGVDVLVPGLNGTYQLMSRRNALGQQYRRLVEGWMRGARSRIRPNYMMPS